MTLKTGLTVTISGVRQVLPGVPDMIGEVQVEGTFPDGTKLVSRRGNIHNCAGYKTGKSPWKHSN